jgi:AcrR family transcriptional regulator
MRDTIRQPLRQRNRQVARDVVLDAAEQLLRKSATAEFSMRALAVEAGVGFATPFNHFGNKNAIMQALSSRLIERMASRFSERASAGDAIDRVLAMGQISVGLLLEQPNVYKVVVGSLGVVSPVPSAVRKQSEGLWLLALGDFAGIAAEAIDVARAVLSQQLAFAFRGCLSFWIADELDDALLASAFETGASVTLLGFADPERRPYLLERITESRMLRNRQSADSSG